MDRTAQSVWKGCLAYIEDNINEQSFKTWFLPIKPVKLQEKVLSIQVPSKFFYEWLEEHYIRLLKSAITKELGADAKLVYSIVMENAYDNARPSTIKLPSSQRGRSRTPK